MKRFIHFSTRLFVVFFICLGSIISSFGQTQNEEKGEIIEVESDCGFDADIEIKISECDLYQDVEIEISCQGNWDIEAIEAPREEEEEEDKIFRIVEQNAVFEGGMDYFYEIVNNQIRFSETMKEGRVFLQYVIDTTGTMTDVKMIRGLSEENDKEALRIMNLISEYYKWKPAELRGKKVKVRMNIPIVFKKKEKIKLNTERIYIR